MREPDDRTRTHELDPGAVERLVLRLPERYAALRLLGAGGQGTVWLADDRELGEQVAIKVLARLDEVAAERVRREVRLCRRLRHANLTEIYELIEAGEHLAVVMEHLPGGSLKDRLRDGPLPIAEVERTARELLAGLAHLHDHGIVHRDVKPGNVLFGGDGAARLADFGLLRSLTEHDDLTRTGFSVGTPAYMSPEQVRGEEPSPTSDLYSLGITMFEAIAGGAPFVAASGLEVAHLHLTRRPPPVRRLRPDCPRWLAAFVERLLEKDPRRRWRDAGAALVAFERRRPGLTRRTRRSLAAAAVLAATAAGGVLIAGQLRERAGLAVRVESTSLVATSTAGRELWRQELPLKSLNATVGDVLPPRGAEIVTAEVTTTAGEVCSTEAVVRDNRGTVLRREAIGHGEAINVFPYFSDSYAPHPGPSLFDLDRDSFEDVILPLNHNVFYPSMLFVWRPAGSRRSQAVLANSGHLNDVRVADLDGDGAPELVVTGVNNVLGYQNIVAILGLIRAARADFSGSRSPDLMNFARGMDDERAALRAYTMLGETRGLALIESADRDGITLRAGDRLVRLDSSGNPTDSLLSGKGPEPRREFWTDRSDTGPLLTQTPERAGVLVDAFEARHPAVCAEAPSRDAALMLFARDLGDAGRPDLGAALLARAEHGAATIRRVRRQRGELLLLAGRHREARVSLERAATSAGRGSAPVDEMTMLALDAAVSGDGGTFDSVLQLWFSAANANAGQNPSHLVAFRAFTEGKWQQANPRGMQWDVDARQWQVLAQWAALEDGAPAATVLGALDRLGATPETRDLSLVVQARARMLAGDTASAADLARRALQALQGQARRAYEPFLWEAMAHWVLGAALADSGDLAAARPHLEIAARRLPATWLARDARARLHRLRS